MSSWTSWSLCSNGCGNGWSTRTRSIVTSALCRGKACGTRSDKKQCTDYRENRDCVVSCRRCKSQKMNRVWYISVAFHVRVRWGYEWESDFITFSRVLNKWKKNYNSLSNEKAPDRPSGFNPWTWELCSLAKHFTLTVPLSTQLYKWVPVNLVLWG